MTHSRRNFLKTLGVTASAAAVMRLIDGPFSLVQRIEAAPIGAGEFKTLADEAFDQARQLGCAYADILITGTRTGSVSLRNSPGSLFGVKSELNHFSTVIESASFRVQVRTLHSDAWGFADWPRVKEREISLLTAQAVARAQTNGGAHRTPISLAPVGDFKQRCIRIHQEDDLRELINEHMESEHAVDAVAITFRTEETFFAKSDGACFRTTRLFWL